MRLEKCLSMKKGILTKILVFLLTVVLIFSTVVFSSNAQNENNVVVGGYTFEVIDKDYGGVTITYNEDGKEYRFYLDKENEEGKAAVDISVQSNSMERSMVSNSYLFEFDENTKYTDNSVDVSSAKLIDNATGEEYSLNENARVAFVIPVGIPLLAAAIEALLVVGSAIIIAGVAYTIVEEVATELKKQDTYRYYRAILENNAVYVGGALDYTLAYTLARSNDSSGTVLATSLSYARGLASNNYRGPENHGAGNGYWYHIHVKSGTTTYKTHVWYL